MFVPTVSVVIPTYNCAEFLPKAIESVLAQTYKDFEILVVDDGSTDATSEIITPYLDRVQFIRQENTGLPGARNTGIRASHGEFIALLDADDTWLPEKLGLQLPRFSDPEVLIVFSDFSVKYGDGRPSLPSYLAERPLTCEGHVIDKYVQSRFLFPSTMVLRRDAMERCGLFDEEMRACEDLELFARLCLQGKVAWIREPLMVRYEGTHNITGNSERMLHYMIVAFTKVLAKVPDMPRGARRAIEKELGKHHQWRAHAALRQGEKGEARADALRAIRLAPKSLREVVLTLIASMLPQRIYKRMKQSKPNGQAATPESIC
jgi:glycosyltransferase involved in cell wall biosynthesis